MPHKFLRMHMRDECLHRLGQPCRWGCGLANERLPTMAQHEKDECPLRPVDCPYGCGKQLPHWRLERHLKQCQAKLAPCPRCNRMVSGKDMPAHNGKFTYGKALVCEKLTVECPLGCGAKMLFKDKDAHFGAGDNWKAPGCPNMKVSCPDCGEKMKRKDVPAHLQKTCIKRIVPCGLGCDAYLREDQRRAHEEDE